MDQPVDSIALLQAFAELDPQVRNVPWVSNCAGEVFVEDGSEQGLRIGHFQGDANLARFVVEAHALMLSMAAGAALPR